MGRGGTRRQDALSNGRTPPERARRTLLLRSTALRAAALLLLAHPPALGQSLPQAGALPQNARPQGGQVVAGQAGIARTPTVTVITQSSQRAVIDWTSFNLGSAQSVQFVQPGASASTLNRVLGPDPSRIAGRIGANGQVVLVNQSGVLFTGTAQVNAQSLVVSMADISNRNAMAGRMVFDRPGKPGATVVNQGTITVGDTGLAALVAPAVANSGTIVARMGQVVLAGGTRATLDLYGDGLLAVDVTGRVQQVPNGPDGKPVSALVTNTGTILAAGGHVVLTAAAVDGVVQDLVSAGGRIAVDNPQGAGGTVVLQGIGGALTIQGRVSATGATGGQIAAVATQAVALADSARLDASGRGGGGTIEIGTGAISTGAIGTARRTSIAAGARVLARATVGGNGGRVTVLSTQATDMLGRITATGGPHGGNGGTVEVSGARTLRLTGGIDVTAAAGGAGSILIDPASLTIETGGSTALGGSTLSVATLDSLAGNVVLQATDSIEVRDAVAMLRPGASLSLQSGGNISVLAGIATAGTLALLAGAGLTGAPGAGNILLAGGVRLAAQRVTLATVQAGGAGGTISVAGTAAATAGSRIDLSGALAGGTLELAPASPGAMQLGGVQPAAGTVWLDTALPPGFAASAGFVPGTLRIGAATGAGGSLVTSATSIDVESLPQRSGTQVVPVALDLHSTGGIGEGGGLGLSGVALLTGSAGGGVSLNEAGHNQIASLGSFAAGGGFVLLDSPPSGTLMLVGGLSAPSLSLSVAGGITEAGGTIDTGALTIAAAGGGVALTAGGNSIATLAGLSAPGRVVALVDAAALTVSGPVGGASVALRAAALTVGGSASFAGADGSILLQATGDLSIAQAIAATQTGASLTLQAGGTIAVGANLQAAARLLLAAGLGFTGGPAAGDILLADGVRLSGHDVLLSAVQARATGGTIAVTGTAAATAGSTLAVQGAVAGGTLELAPSRAAAVQLGGLQPTQLLNAGGLWVTLALPSGFVPSPGYGAGTVRIGGATDGNGKLVASAGSITLAGLYLGAAPVTLDLRATGDVSEAASAGLGGVARLTGAVAGSVVLDQAAFNHIAMVGDFAAGGAFMLDDVPAAGLALTGTISAAAVAILSAGAGITLDSAGRIAASAISLTTTGGSLILGGAIAAGTVGLVAEAGGIVQVGGSLSAVSLSGSARGDVALQGSANSVATLAGFAAGSHAFALNDAGALDVAGSLAAGSVTLRAAGLTVGGAAPFAAGDALVLLQSAGSIVVRSAIALDGGALALRASGDVVLGGSIRLGGGRLAVGAGVAFSAGQAAHGGNVTLDPGELLVARSIALSAGQGGSAGARVGGQVVVAPGGTATALASSAITIAGAVTGGTLELAPSAAQAVQLGGSQPASGLFVGFDLSAITAPAGLVPGTVRVGAFTAGGLVATATSVDLAGLVLKDGTGAYVPLNLDLQVRAGGSIVERRGTGLGGIATLTGNSPGAGGDIALDQQAFNHIAVLGALVAGGTVSVADATALTVTSLAPNGHAGAVSGSAVVLTAAGDLTLAGDVAATGALTLTSQSGAILQSSGSIAAATLYGAAAGDASLTLANRIAKLGAFAAGGALTLDDPAGLTVTAATASGGIGAVSGQAVTLSVPAGSLTIAGAVSGTASVRLTAFGGSISETLPGAAAPAGSIATGTLTAAAAGNLLLTGGNSIATLGLVSAGGALAVTDTVALAVDAAFGSSVALTTTAGDLQLAGTVVALAGATLNAAGAIAQTTGSLIASSLSGTAGGAVVLSSASNAIDTLGGFAAGQSFELVESNPLAVAGPISATAVLLKAVSLTLEGAIGGGTRPAASLTLVATAGTIAQTGGSIDAGTLSATAPADVLLRQPGNVVATLGSFVATGSTLALLDAAPLAVAGPVVADMVSLQAPSLTLAGALSGASSVTLGATAGGIAQRGGSLQTAMLNATAAGDLSLTQPGNVIAVLGSLAAPGHAVALADSSGLTVSGPVLGDSVGLSTAGSLSLPGRVQAAGTLTLTAGGGIDEGPGGSGAIVAGVLAGGAGGSANLTATGNLIGTLADFSVGHAGGAAASLSVTDGMALRVAGIVGDCNGDVTLTTGGAFGIAIGGASAAATLYATNALTLNAPGGVSLDGAGSSVVVQGAATVATPLLRQSNGSMVIGGDLAITGTIAQSGGVLATGGTLSLGGGASVGGLLLAIALAPTLDSAAAPGLGWLTLAGGTLATGSDLYLGTYTLAGGNIGTLGTTGSVQLASLGIAAGGAILSGGTVAIAGALVQTGGEISGNVLSVGAGPVAAAGGFGLGANSGSVTQAGGTLTAVGAINLWSAGAVTLGGLVAAGDTLGVSGGAIAQTGGELFGRSGVRLYASTGDAAQSAGAVLAVDVGTAIVQAPRGRNGFNGFAAAPLLVTLGSELAVDVTCACAGQPPAVSTQAAVAFLSPSVAAGPLAAGTGVDVVLVGDSIGIDRAIGARHLALYARSGITEAATASIAAATLGGSVGVPGASAFDPALLALDGGIGGIWNAPVLASATLLAAGNSVATLGGFAATGDLRFRGGAANGVLTLAGALTAAGQLEIDGQGGMALGPGVVVAGSTVLLTAGQSIALTGTASPLATPVVFGAQSVTISAAGSYLQTGGLLAGGAIVVTAPDKRFAGALVLATGGGITLAGGASTVGPGSVLAASGPAGGMILDNVTQSGGSIAASGAVAIAALTQTGGLLAATGDVTAGVLQQVSGTLSAGGSVSGQLAAAVLDGSIVAGGDVTLASAGGLTMTGTVAGAGRVGLTAATLLQSAGVVSGGAGVTLSATAGDARQAAAAAVGGGASQSSGILVQAPHGTAAFFSFAAADPVIAGSVGVAAIDCPRCADPFAAASGAVVVPGSVVPASVQPAPQPARVAAVLTGASVEIAGALTAGSLGLYASGNIGEAAGGILDVLTLTGSAGVGNAAYGIAATQGASAVLGNANAVVALAGFRTAQDFGLTVAGATSVTGAVVAGAGGRGGNVTLLAGSSLTLGAGVAAAPGAGLGGLLSATAPAVDVLGGVALSAQRIAITAANTIAVGLNGPVSLDGGGQSGAGGLIPGQAGITPPTDTSRATTPGVFLTIGTTLNGYRGIDAATGAGSIVLGAVDVSGGVLRLALPDNLAGNRASLGNAGSISLGNVLAPGSDLILWIGNGRATGSLSARHLALFYTGQSARATLGGSLDTPQGNAVTGPAAASLAGVGRYLGGTTVVYAAQPAVSFGACPVSSINCQIVDLRQTIPTMSPVESDTFFIPEAQDDPDVLLPNISNQDY